MFSWYYVFYIHGGYCIHDLKLPSTQCAHQTIIGNKYELIVWTRRTIMTSVAFQMFYYVISFPAAVSLAVFHLMIYFHFSLKFPHFHEDLAMCFKTLTYFLNEFCFFLFLDYLALFARLVSLSSHPPFFSFLVFFYLILKV